MYILIHSFHFSAIPQILLSITALDACLNLRTAHMQLGANQSTDRTLGLLTPIAMDTQSAMISETQRQFRIALCGACETAWDVQSCPEFEDSREERGFRSTALPGRRRSALAHAASLHPNMPE